MLSSVQSAATSGDRSKRGGVGGVELGRRGTAAGKQLMEVAISILPSFGIASSDQNRLRQKELLMKIVQ